MASVLRPCKINYCSGYIGCLYFIIKKNGWHNKKSENQKNNKKTVYDLAIQIMDCFLSLFALNIFKLED